AAMHGDKVLVEIEHRKTGGRAEGRIVRVAERAHDTVVGTFHFGQRYNYVTPIDEKITQEIIIPPSAERPQIPPEAERPETGVKEKNNRQKGRHRVIGQEARRRDTAQPGAGEWHALDGLVVGAA